MSLGINLLAELCRKAATILDGFDIEIIEKHHNQKIDAPSGTALMIADAMTEVFTVFKRCNKYIGETMPWALAKDESKKDRLATVLYNLVEGICIGTSLLESFMPETTERIFAQLNGGKRALEECETWGLYPSGNKVTEKPEILFARLDLAEVMKKVEELHPPVVEAAEEVVEEVTAETAAEEITLPAEEPVQVEEAEKFKNISSLFEE